MATDRVALIRQLFDALNRPDWSAIVPHLTPDVVADNMRTRGEQQRIFRGPEEVRQGWELFTDVWDSVQIDIGDVTLIGDQVVVPIPGRFRGRDGIEVTTRPTWLFTFRGDEIAEICFYQEEHEALEAARTLQAR